MPSKSHKELKRLVFSKLTAYTKDHHYWSNYDPSQDISTGYYRGSTIITINWKKDLVVLSDGGWRIKTTKALLNALLPMGWSLYQDRSEWYLKIDEHNVFKWTGSQALSLSKSYGVYATSWSTIAIAPGTVYIKPLMSIKVVTIVKAPEGYFICEASSIEVMKPTYGQQLIKWITTKVIGPIKTKKEAEATALTYAVQHKLPYIERLPRASTVAYELNP